MSTVEKHQISGLDERERGFNRLAELERFDGGYRAVWQYEQAVVTTPVREATPEALDELIRMLQARGYTQLRSRVCFRGETYLGTQELWMEYPDAGRRNRGLLRRLLNPVRRLLGPKD
jgi:hypothetical protein